MGEPVESIRVSVQDSGIGIDRNDISRILSGEYRTDASRTGEGYGIGVSISQKMLLSHGSRLEIDSQPGRGSVFSFVLPAWPMPQKTRR